VIFLFSESIQKMDIVDPTCRKFLDAVNSAKGPLIYTLSPSEARKILEDAAQADPLSGPTPKKPAEIEAEPQKHQKATCASA